MEIKELGHVVLYVSNLERSADFYKNILGFKEIFREPGAAAFSGGRTHHELLLLEVGIAVRKKTMEPGLYHIGFKIGDTTETLRAAYQELKGAGATIVGTADHRVTHSLYILDPDQNELELYVDVSDEWKKDPKAAMAPTRSLRLD